MQYHAWFDCHRGPHGFADGPVGEDIHVNNLAGNTATWAPGCAHVRRRPEDARRAAIADWATDPRRQYRAAVSRS